MSSYQIINHGWDNAQYFQGCGTAYTEFDHVQTGCGDNAAEAYADAVESIYQCHTTAEAEALQLPKKPHGIRKADKVPAKSEDCYWYVSIRYTL